MKSVTQPFFFSLQIQPLNPHRRQTSLHSISPLSLSSLKTHPKRPFPIKSQQTHLNETQSTSTQDDGIPIDHVKTLARFKSLHNHITVVQVSRAADHPFAGSRLLLLDSPGNIHSISFTFPNRRLFTSTYFDVFATLPPILPPGPLAVLGFGAGSAAKLILESYPTGVVHGWEIDPAVISVGREYFDLSWLERKFPDRLKVYIGDAMGAEIEDGFSGILVDLFNKGCLIPELQDPRTWEKMKRRLRRGGRIMVNVGGSCVEAEDGSDGRVVMEESVRALEKVFPGRVSVLTMGNRNEDSSIAMTGEMPDVGEWKTALPKALRFYADMWTPFHG
ncbi:uncharacterized protein LOC131335888 [Rhododendron vialii]|uniref:uncharacterized protein LOC131335888 n=1 Tax=Rhododendron vialii TaxID=182163 RepID=UPI00265E46F7|nr:uncharacterized protein LOC131335888 [Rhododendron vialii]XP_058227428.1 uncharacterized protein LOC131335888 [Rhododendron vialii]XP_058227429.1 uncharacterized protein LOC131335888 [Rhododendron vialii]